MKTMSFREKAIRSWMLDHGLRPSDIKKESGASYASVTLTIQGERNHQGVIDTFISKGCPWELFQIGRAVKVRLKKKGGAK